MADHLQVYYKTNNSALKKHPIIKTIKLDRFTINKSNMTNPGAIKVSNGRKG